MYVYLCTALPIIRKLKSIYTVYNINIGKSAFYRLKKYAHLFAHRPVFFATKALTMLKFSTNILHYIALTIQQLYPNERISQVVRPSEIRLFTPIYSAFHRPQFVFR